MVLRRLSAICASTILVAAAAGPATAAPAVKDPPPRPSATDGAVNLQSITELVDGAAETGLLPAQAPIPDMGLAGRLLGVLSDLPPVFTRILSAPYATTEVVAAVDHMPFEGGTRYLITPARQVADLPATARFAGWTQAVAKGVPDTPTLRHQFYCHYDARGFIRNKPSWNLESTRPDRGMEGFYKHWCN